jgi:CTP synthase
VGLEDAHSTEFNSQTKHPVIDILPGQDGKKMGGTMRLGNYNARLKPNSKTLKVYGTNKIVERHRHRYEFNNDFGPQLSKAGLIFAAKSMDGNLVEMIELAEHQFFIASQFHPEFLSRPNRPHPLFREFIGAIRNNNLASNKKSKINNSTY